MGKMTGRREIDATCDEDTFVIKQNRRAQIRPSLERLRRRFRLLATNSIPGGGVSAANNSSKSFQTERQPIGTTLIVQVNGWACEALLPLLRAAGYNVRVVEDRDALEALEGESIMLLIVGGAADPKLYRALRRASAAPILALVPWADRDKMLEAFGAGVDDYQASPISNTEIAARARAMLRHAKRLSPSVKSPL